MISVSFVCVAHAVKVISIGQKQVDLDDMEHLVAQDGSSGFSYPCRCGEAFVCAEEDLTETSDSLLVQCQGCSLIIRVLYTVADEA